MWEGHETHHRNVAPLCTAALAGRTGSCAWISPSASITATPLDDYVPDYIGGRGVAARLAWDEYPRPEDPFRPASPLIIMTGALTGTRSPYSGRTSISGFSPQAYPHNWYTRANIGHHWGAALKRAGYDGLADHRRLRVTDAVDHSG